MWSDNNVVSSLYVALHAQKKQVSVYLVKKISLSDALLWVMTRLMMLPIMLLITPNYLKYYTLIAQIRPRRGIH